jgi:hypothetical protein
MNKTKTVRDLLHETHIQLVQENGVVITQKELALWYGIDPVTFNKYYNGERVPTGKFLHKIGAKTPEVYDVLGLERPDKRLENLSELYKATPVEKRDELLFRVKEFLEEIGADTGNVD